MTRDKLADLPVPYYYMEPKFCGCEEWKRGIISLGEYAHIRFNEVKEDLKSFPYKNLTEWMESPVDEDEDDDSIALLKHLWRLCTDE